jgi:hypothetical protein
MIKNIKINIGSKKFIKKLKQNKKKNPPDKGTFLFFIFTNFL